MFPFDKAALPQLTTRKALIIVDFQNDFVSADGALPVTDPEGFVDRTLELAEAFRSQGDVVWVHSSFEAARPVVNDHIITSDSILPKTRRPGNLASSRRRLELSNSEPTGPPDPEAFLSHEKPICVRPSTLGIEPPQTVKEAMRKEDMTLKKTHYSAFEAGHLLRMLRAKLVVDLFICGSLANVGVYATAMDAATHGMSITIVEDCCGWRSNSRETVAMTNLMELTGCEVLSSEEILETMQPKPSKPTMKAEVAPPISNTAATTAAAKNIWETLPPDIVQSMTALRLDAEMPKPEPVGDSSKTDADGAPITKPKEASNSNVEKPEGQNGSPLNELKESEVRRSTAPKSIEQSDSTTPLGSNDEKLEAVSSDDEELNGLAGLCEGDTRIIENVLPPSLEAGIFDKLRQEVSWQRMSHQGGEVPRLVAVQGDVKEDGSMPVYRHPSDESPPLLPFSKTVMAIKAEAEKHLGHPLNHVLIQHYRDGNDYISEHSDKSLDIVRDSYITNVSLGAERTMVFRTKRQDKDHTRTSSETPPDSQRKIQRAQLPHNSLCRMGLRTNMKWLHAIRQDKRADRDKSPAELAYKGGRISLTFRRIGTFLDKDESIIWGQGATGKTREDAHPVINGQTTEAIAMLRAFGTENHSSVFDWDAYYGKGFDVLHLRTAPRLFSSSDAVSNMRIALMLAERGINYAKGSLDAGNKSAKSSSVDDRDGGEAARVKFTDNDAAKSTVEGEMAIMLYLDSYKPENVAPPKAELALRYTRFQQGLRLLDTWHRIERSKENGTKALLKPVKQELATWNGYTAASKCGFLAGEGLSLPDFAVWPVLHDIVERCGAEVFEGMEDLKRYYMSVKERESTQRVIGKGLSAKD